MDSTNQAGNRREDASSCRPTAVQRVAGGWKVPIWAIRARGAFGGQVGEISAAEMSSTRSAAVETPPVGEMGIVESQVGGGAANVFFRKGYRTSLGIADHVKAYRTNLNMSDQDEACRTK